MRELALQLVVGAALVGLGLGAVWLFAGDRAWAMNLDLAYGLGALVVSVPAILILERRRRRNRRP